MRRICHLTSAHPQNDIRIFVKECCSLADAGYEVHLIVPNTKDDQKNGVIIHGIENSNTNRFIRMTKTVWKVYKSARKVDAEIYHFHDPELLLIGLLLKLKGKKVIYDVHEDVPRQMLAKKWIPRRLRKPISRVFEGFENYCASRLDSIVTATPFIRERFLKINRNTIDVNNFPILKEFKDINLDFRTKDRAVCYVGKIDEIRGIFELLEAIKLAEKKLLLAGKFNTASERNKAMSMEGWKNTEDLGFLNRNEIANIMERSMGGLVVLHPKVNYLDALPIKMFEYMAAGIPVVASNFPLWKEIVDENRCGVCVDPFNINEISNAINWIIKNPSEAERLGRNGRLAVEQKYNWENERQKLYKVYESI